MTSLAWLHVSDWHQRGSAFERATVRDELMKDVAARAEIDPRLEQLDLLAFTGDIAFSGKAEEYAAVSRELFDPLLAVTRLSAEQVIVIPGNHDIDQTTLALFSPTLLESLDSATATEELLSNPQTVRILLEPFANYADFACSVSALDPHQMPAYGFSRHINVGDFVVRVVGVNSALFSGRNRNPDGRVSDEGSLLIGQSQIRPLLTSDVPADVHILLMHHPLAWCAEFERPVLRRQFAASFDFVLHGHEHVPNVQVIEEAAGRSVTIPAGASYGPDPSTYSHSYNYVVVDLTEGIGVVHLRRWSPVNNCWVADTETTTTGRFEFKLSSHEPAQPASIASSTDSDRSERAERAITNYRRAIARRYAVADYRGIAGVPGSPLAASLSADDLYVVPRLVPADRTEVRERERELLRQLDDPDLSTGERTRCEEEYAALTGQQWQPLDGGESATSLGTALQENTHVVLLGSPGVGKSALTRFLARTCAGELALMQERLGWYENLVPVVVPLAAYAEARTQRPNLSLRQFMLDRLAENHTAELADAVGVLLDDSGCLILLDGIDEIPDSRARTRLVQAVDEFLADHSRLRTVVTSRPYGYIRLAGAIPHFQLPNFSEAEVAEFVGKYYRATERHAHPSAPDFAKADEDAEALLAEIEQNQRVSELATNPLMLVIIALIRYERAHLIEERVQLYHRAVTTLVDTWAQWRAGGEMRREAIPLDRILRVWAAVADWMHRERPTGVVHRRQLIGKLTTVIRERGFDADERSEDLAEKYFAVVAGSGLLEQRAEDIFAFWHPTFEEFLAAVHCSTPTSDARAKMVALRADPRWREVILLAVGYVGLIVLDGDTATRLVEALWTHDVPAPDALLHECLGLAAAAVAEYPGIRRDTADRLLRQIVAVLAEQPSHPNAIDAFAVAARAVSRLVPSRELAAGLGRIIHAEHWRVRMEVARLAGNGAASGASDCLEMCQTLYQDSDPDVRAYAALGLLRAGTHEHDVWNAALAAYNSRFALIETSLVRLLDTVPDDELLALVGSPEIKVLDLTAVCRRAGRLTDAVRERARARLATLRESDLAQYVRLVAMLDDDPLDLRGLPSESLGQLDFDTRVLAAEAVLRDQAASDGAIDTLLGVVGDEGATLNVRVEALRVLSHQDVDVEKLSTALVGLGRRDPSLVAYMVRNSVGSGGKLYEALVAQLQGGDEHMMVLAGTLTGDQRTLRAAFVLALERAVSVEDRWAAVRALHDHGDALDGRLDLVREAVSQLAPPEQIAAANMLARVSEDPADAELARSVLEPAYTPGRDAAVLLGLLQVGAGLDDVWGLIETYGQPQVPYPGLALARRFVAGGQLGRALEILRAVAASSYDEPLLGEQVANLAAEIVTMEPSLEPELSSWGYDLRSGGYARALALLMLKPKEGADALGRLLEPPLQLSTLMDGDNPSAWPDATWHAISVGLWGTSASSYVRATIRQKLNDWFVTRAYGEAL